VREWRAGAGQRRVARIPASESTSEEAWRLASASPLHAFSRRPDYRSTQSAPCARGLYSREGCSPWGCPLSTGPRAEPMVCGRRWGSDCWANRLTETRTTPCGKSEESLGMAVRRRVRGAGSSCRSIRQRASPMQPCGNTPDMKEVRAAFLKSPHASPSLANASAIVARSRWGCPHPECQRDPRNISAATSG
jgi:hypothetical protein